MIRLAGGTYPSVPLVMLVNTDQIHRAVRSREAVNPDIPCTLPAPICS